MTNEKAVNEKLMGILGEMVNIKTDYAKEFGDTCIMCGFPVNKKDRIKMISQAHDQIIELFREEEK